MSRSDRLGFICFAGLFILTLASSVYAQGSIGVFATSDGTLCNLYDTVPGSTLIVHVVHVGSSCATGSEFKVTEGGGFVGTFSHEVYQFDQISGSCRLGISVDYGGEISSPALIASIVYFVSGSSAPCSWIRVEAHPLSGGIFMDDCSQPAQQVGISGGTANINPNQNCQCSVENENHSWGAIKALYY